MPFLVDAGTRVAVQGATGRLGTLTVELLRDSGTEPLVGVTPGKGGTTVGGLPIVDTMSEAAERGANASIVLVPAMLLEDAVMEAVDAGMDPIVAMVDGVPIGISMRIAAAARARGVTLIGPNSPGVISPGVAMLAALRSSFYERGSIAVLSRSGGMMTTIANTLTTADIGQSTCVGVGGDAVIGLDLVEAASLAEADPETTGIVVFGEVGTTQEQRLADAVRDGRVTKPVAAYIAGVSARTGVRYSHAGASSEGAGSGAAAKRAALAGAGADVVTSYKEIVDAIRGWG
jgi:succinyl-CoA synthetase alpha subunit